MHGTLVTKADFYEECERYFTKSGEKDAAL